MSFNFYSQEPVIASLRRIANEQIQKAINEIDDNELNTIETAHQVRKRCKKIRGLLRLVRPGFESAYQYENSLFRDAAKRLSDMRDKQAVVNTIDKLHEHFSESVKPVPLCVLFRKR